MKKADEILSGGAGKRAVQEGVPDRLESGIRGQFLTSFVGRMTPGTKDFSWSIFSGNGVQNSADLDAQSGVSANRNHGQIRHELVREKRAEERRNRGWFFGF
jgi:hypothetical protein